MGRVWGSARTAESFTRMALIAAVAIIAMTTTAIADNESGTLSTQVETPAHRFGVYASLGNPYPTLLGLNVAYNINRDLRASLGYGEVEATTGISINESGMTTQTVSAKTYAAGAEYFFLDSPVRAVAGVRAGYFQVSGQGEIEIDGFKKSTGYVYSNLGMDWVSRDGYQIGGGYNVAFVGASGAGFYLNSGWFF